MGGRQTNVKHFILRRQVIKENVTGTKIFLATLNFVLSNRMPGADLKVSRMTPLESKRSFGSKLNSRPPLACKVASLAYCTAAGDLAFTRGIMTVIPLLSLLVN